MVDLAPRLGTPTPSPFSTAHAAPAPGAPDVGPELAWMQALGVDVRSLPAVGEAVEPRGLGPGGVLRPVLYLIDEGEPAPRCGELEDWIRRPLDPVELRARAERLLAQARTMEQVRARSASANVELDDDDVLHVRDELVLLSPQEAVLLRTLLASLGLVVGRDDLVAAAWGDELPPDPRALDNRIRALRLRLDGVGLAIHTIRGRGFMVEEA